MDAPSSTSAPVDVGRVLTTLFTGYKDGTDFAFLRTACRPKLERFLTLRDVDSDEVVKSARSFFRGKLGVTYVPKLDALRVEQVADGVVARLPVEMAWTTRAPKDWGDDWPALGSDGPRVSRDVTVDVEIALDSSRKITRYLETGVRAPALRVTLEPKCVDEVSDPSGFASMLSASEDDIEPARKGAHPNESSIVHDLGETFTLSETAKGPTVARRVRTPGGVGWMLDSVSFAVQAGTPETCAKAGSEAEVAACLSQTSAGRSECLIPVGDAGQ